MASGTTPVSQVSSSHVSQDLESTLREDRLFPPPLEFIPQIRSNQIPEKRHILLPGELIVRQSTAEARYGAQDPESESRSVARRNTAVRELLD